LSFTIIIVLQLTAVPAPGTIGWGGGASFSLQRHPLLIAQKVLKMFFSCFVNVMCWSVLFY